MCIEHLLQFPTIKQNDKTFIRASRSNWVKTAWISSAKNNKQDSSQESTMQVTVRLSHSKPYGKYHMCRNIYYGLFCRKKLFPSMIQNEEEPQNRTDGELSKLSCYEVQNSFSLI